MHPLQTTDVGKDASIFCHLCVEIIKTVHKETTLNPSIDVDDNDDDECMHSSIDAEAVNAVGLN